jgi:hypothetical protein
MNALNKKTQENLTTKFVKNMNSANFFDSDRVEVIVKDGIEVVDLNLTSIPTDECIHLLDLIDSYAKKNQPKPFLMTINCHKAPNNRTLMERNQKTLMGAQNLISYTALYNVNGFGKIVVKMLRLLTKNPIECCDSRDEAVDYLVKKTKELQINLEE